MRLVENGMFRAKEDLGKDAGGGGNVVKDQEEKGSARKDFVIAVQDESEGKDNLRVLLREGDMSGSLQRVFALSDVPPDIRRVDNRPLHERVARLLIQAARDSIFVHGDEAATRVFLNELNSPFIRERLSKDKLFTASLRSVFLLLDKVEKYDPEKLQAEFQELARYFNEEVSEEEAGDPTTVLHGLYKEYARKQEEARKKAEQERIEFARAPRSEKKKPFWQRLGKAK